MFTFRGIPCIYYGSEIKFQKGLRIDAGTTPALSTTGRAYFGDDLKGTLNKTGFCNYRASVPALRKGQYSVSDISYSGMVFKKRYSNASKGIDSFALVSISGSATFHNIPNGTYLELVTGKIGMDGTYLK